MLSILNFFRGPDINIDFRSVMDNRRSCGRGKAVGVKQIRFVVFQRGCMKLSAAIRATTDVHACRPVLFDSKANLRTIVKYFRGN